MAYHNEPESETLRNHPSFSEDDSPTEEFIVPTEAQLAAWIAGIEADEALENNGNKENKPTLQEPTTTTIKPETHTPPFITPEMQFEMVDYKPLMKQIEDMCAYEQIQFRMRGTNYREAFQELALELYKTRPNIFKMSTFKDLFITNAQQLRNRFQANDYSSIEISLIMELRANGLMLMMQNDVITIPKTRESDSK